jgi:branched-chain amino acid transport system substrate-binding protein
MRLTMTAIVAALMVSVTGGAVIAADQPGVTATEIKIGAVYPFSGPASGLGATGKGVAAYIQAINDRGGVNDRKINYITLDDGYSPPKTVEQVRRLVESDEVSFLFGQLGTPGNSAVAKYLRAKSVPSLAIFSGSSKFADVKEFPLTTTGLVNYDIEGKIYAKFLDRSIPSGKYAILFQNDDVGKDYVAAFRSYFKSDFDKRVIALGYEVTEPTVESQVVKLKSSGADALFIAGTPKFAAQAIRKSREIGWKAPIVINYPSSSVANTLAPAGLENSIGVVVGTITKDPSDPKWKDDEGVKAYRKFFDTYLPGADYRNTSYLTGYMTGMILEQILKQCGDDFSRKNIVAQAKAVKDLVIPMAFPGVLVNTSSTNNNLWSQLQMQRWAGENWEQFGGVLDANSE